MNTPTEQLMSALKEEPCTAKELSRRLTYEELCDHDICGRITFGAHSALKDIYYVKSDEAKALRFYVRTNWRTIGGIIKNGKYKTFPPKFAKAIKENFNREKSILEGEIGSMQDDIEDLKSKIEEYEELEKLM